VIDDAQIESESKLYSISNLQNGFSSSGVFKYFQNMDSNEEFNELRQKLKNTTGAINAGRMIVMPFLPAQDMPSNVYEPIQLQNIDSLFEKQKEEAKNNINQRFNIPNALIGKDSTGNFATQRVQEHFEFYNSITESLRQNLEIDLNILLSNSIYKDAFQFPIQIKPLQYMQQNGDIEVTSKSEQIRIESQAALKGTVGGVQGILQIQQSVSSGLTQYDAAIEILIDIYGYSAEQARKILGEPIQKFPDNPNTVE
jgi:hypothetical protein